MPSLSVKILRLSICDEIKSIIVIILIEKTKTFLIWSKYSECWNKFPKGRNGDVICNIAHAKGTICRIIS
jgi:hypothetical protein